MNPQYSLGEVLHLAGLGQNLMNAAFSTVIARKHYGNEIDDGELEQRHSRLIQRFLKQLKQMCSELAEKQLVSSINLGEIATAVARGWII